MNWTNELLEQLTFHWDNQVRPNLADLTDDEYLWEPVLDTWSIRPRSEARSAMAAGAGDMVADFEFPEPDPTPFTTIAWRMGHVIVGIFGMRNASHFGGPPMDYSTFDWAGTAKGALDQLDSVYAGWVEGVRGLDEEALARPCGDVEGDYGHLSMAALVLHINREAIHHMAEVALVRDLYRQRR